MENTEIWLSWEMIMKYRCRINSCCNVCSWNTTEKIERALRENCNVNQYFRPPIKNCHHLCCEDSAKSSWAVMSLVGRMFQEMYFHYVNVPQSHRNKTPSLPRTLNAENDLKLRQEYLILISTKRKTFIRSACYYEWSYCRNVIFESKSQTNYFLRTFQ